MDFDRIIGQLSEEQLDDLSQKIEESRKLRSQLVTYEVTFRVSFLPFAHQGERICSLCDFRADLANELPNHVEDWFNLIDKPEGVSGIHVRRIDQDSQEESTDDLSQGIKECQEKLVGLLQSRNLLS